MLLEEIKNIKSEKRDLRNFGIPFGVVLGLLSLLLWCKEKDTYIIFMALSFLFFFFGFVLPSLLKPLQKAWMTLAVVLGFFMTKVILALLFYLVFTAISLGGKALRQAVSRPEDGQFPKKLLDLQKAQTLLQE